MGETVGGQGDTGERVRGAGEGDRWGDSGGQGETGGG